MVQGQGFQFCCTASEIGGFYNDTQDDIDDALLSHGNVLTIATLSPSQMSGTAPKLEKAGFVKVGTYPGYDGRISLFVRGLTRVKGGRMSVKKTKKTVVLKTGKKVVKKTKNGNVTR